MSSNSDDPQAAPYVSDNETNMTRLSVVDRLRDEYIVTPRDEVLRREFDRLVEGQMAEIESPAERPSRYRRDGRGICLVGESGSGKTRALDNLYRDHPSIPNSSVISGSPIRILSAPSPCTPKQLGRTLLGQLGYPLARDLREHLVWEQVRKRLRALQVAFISIDEMQHATQLANEIERQKLANTLKSLLVDTNWPVSLVIAGLPELAEFVDWDPQLKRRFRFVQFGQIRGPSASVQLTRLICDRATTAGLGLVKGEISELALGLLSAANHQLGLAIEIILEAIEQALTEGAKELERRHFYAVFAARSSSREDNPFKSPSGMNLERPLKSRIEKEKLNKTSGRGW